MTNVFKRPEKKSRKSELFAFAVKALEDAGYTVERIERAGKGSVRKIIKDGKSQVATIRTSQDAWIAFPRNRQDTGWKTLEGADVVVAASVDDKINPRYAKIHLIPAKEMTARFDRARDKKLKAGHVVPKNRGVWLSLYNEEAQEPVNLVGAGAGLKFPPIATFPLNGALSALTPVRSIMEPPNERFTIADAKRKLSAFYGVPEEAITISITH